MKIILEIFISKIFIKNDQKSIFFKVVSNVHEVLTNVSGCFSWTQRTFCEPLNTLVYISCDDICHLLQHEKVVKIAILAPF